MCVSPSPPELKNVLFSGSGSNSAETRILFWKVAKSLAVFATVVPTIPPLERAEGGKSCPFPTYFREITRCFYWIAKDAVHRSGRRITLQWAAVTALSCFTMSHIFRGISSDLGESRGATVLSVWCRANLQDNKEPLTLIKTLFLQLFCRTSAPMSWTRPPIEKSCSVRFHLLILSPSLERPCYHMTASSLLKITLKNT